MSREHSSSSELTWVDPNSAEPLYQQVRRIIETGLSNGTYHRNRPLPSSRYLSASLGVSRNTVNLACQELVAAGLLISKPRSGLYPADSSTSRPTPATPQSAVHSGHSGRRPTDSKEPIEEKKLIGLDWENHIISAPDLWPMRAIIEPDYLRFKYPFLPGQIELQSFPARAWLRAVNSAFDGPNRVTSLRDSVNLDDPLLVESITTQILSAKGILASPQQILITCGVQHALSLLSEVLLDPGRRVAVENPGYVDAARIFSRSGAELEFFDVDENGIVTNPEKQFDLVYVTPSHHHPTNVTLSAGRRAELLSEAATRDFLIIEDDFDSEIRFKGAPTSSMKSIDRDGRVIYLGTFSKFLAPGLRLGYVVAEEPLIRELRERRYYSSKHPSGLLQRSLGLFIDSGEFHRALRHHRVALKRKWETLDSALRESLPWTLPEAPAGGLSFWISGPDDFNATVMSELARRRGVLVSPGESYYLHSNPPKNSFRVGFNAIPQARIVTGVQLLAEAVFEAAGKDGL